MAVEGLCLPADAGRLTEENRARRLSDGAGASGSCRAHSMSPRGQGLACSFSGVGGSVTASQAALTRAREKARGEKRPMAAAWASSLFALFDEAPVYGKASRSGPRTPRCSLPPVPRARMGKARLEAQIVSANVLWQFSGYHLPERKKSIRLIAQCTTD